MLEIRPFCNSDPPRLAMLWVIHHAVYRPAPAVTAAVWEQAIASRHFFRPDRLLVAADDGDPVAWCQWFDGADQTANLAAFCFDATPAGEMGATALLEELQRQVFAAGLTDMLAGIEKDSRWGYQGLDPIGQGIGIDVADDRTNQLLEDAGFDERQRIDRWEVATSDYRPPVNREMLQFRRGTRIETATVTTESLRESAAMFHFEIKRYRLVAPGGGKPLAEIDIWLSDPDIHVMATHQSILGRVASEVDDPQSREAAIRYLIASVIPILAEKHVRAMHRSVSIDCLDEATRLSALKFRRTGAGRLLTKQLLLDHEPNGQPLNVSGHPLSTTE